MVAEFARDLGAAAAVRARGITRAYQRVMEIKPMSRFTREVRSGAREAQLVLFASAAALAGCESSDEPSDVDEGTEAGDLAAIATRVESQPDDPQAAFAIRSSAAGRPEAGEFPGQPGVGAAAEGGAVFALLGDPSGSSSSYPHAVSAAGDVVVGYTGQAGDERAFKHSAAGFELLAGPSARALALSPDGSLIVGRAASKAPGGSAAILWRSASEFELLAGGETDASGTPLYAMVEAAAVLDDGTVFGTCVQSSGDGVSLGCRYAAGALTMLGSGNVYAASAAHHAGAARPDVSAPQLATPSWNGESVGFLPGTDCSAEDSRCFGALKAVARGAALAVGGLSVPDGAGSRLSTAFTYSPAQGVLALPDLPGSASECGATSVSDDGRIVGGHAAGSHGPGAGALWIDGQPVDLHDYVSARGAALPEDFRLGWVTGISGDGRVIVGVGVHAPSEVYEGYRITLTAAP